MNSSVKFCLVMVLLQPLKLFAADIDKAMDAVVFIETSSGSGSGFLINRNTVVTNAHVIGIGECGNLRITGRNKKVLPCDRIISRDNKNDLALIQLGNSVNGDFLTITDSNSLQIGDEVSIMGNPRGVLFVSTQGKIASLSWRQNIRSGGYSINFEESEVFLYDAPTSGGNSGGPAINSCGSLVGVVVASHTKAEDINFAIKSNTLTQLILANKVPFQSGCSSRSARDEKRQIEVAAIAPERDKWSDWDGLYNPFTFGGGIVSLGLTGGLDYGEIQPEHSEQKDPNAHKLWVAGISAFGGLKLGIDEGSSSTFGVFGNSLRSSQYHTVNTYEEQVVHSNSSATYNDYLDTKSNDHEPDNDLSENNSSASIREVEYGAYLYNWIRLSTGSGRIDLNYQDNNGNVIVNHSGRYKVSTLGLLLGDEGWSLSGDLSMLSGGVYKKRSPRGSLGMSYRFHVLD